MPGDFLPTPRSRLSLLSALPFLIEEAVYIQVPVLCEKVDRLMALLSAVTKQNVEDFFNSLIDSVN